MSPWLFMQYGIDILDLFSMTPGQLIYLITVIDYFTKWIEAEELSNLTAANIIQLFKKNVLIRSGVPPSHCHR